jgi:DNA-binding NarL/FixJ family response regulator
MIVTAIRAVAAGRHFLPPELSRRLAERELRPLLSAREAEVLQLIARGLANKQIAAELGVGEATVKTHVAHLLEKLGVADRTRAVTLAIERGLLRM